MGLDKTTEAYARICTRSLMEQADALVRWGEYDEAERLTNRAAAMQIVYGPFEQKPQDMLQRIADARRQAGVAMTACAERAGLCRCRGLGPGSGADVSLHDKKQFSWCGRPARRLPPDNWIRPKCSRVARRRCDCRIRRFAPGEDRPELVLMDIRQMRQQTPSAVVPAGGQYVGQAGANGEPVHTATRAVYDPANDPTRNARASSQQPAYPFNPQYAQRAGSRYGANPNAANPAPPPPPIAGCGSHRPAWPNRRAWRCSSRARRRCGPNDPTRAYELFRQAAAHTNDLDPVTAQRLQDHLQLLSAPSRMRPQQRRTRADLADQAAAQQQLLVRQVAAELAHRESNARAMRATDPKGALAMLEEARKKVETAGLDTASRDQLLRSVDRAIAETKQVIEQNRPQIELAEKNNRIRQDIERQQRVKVEVQEKFAMKIDQFNRLIDEQRYAEAEVVAKQAAELGPNDPVVVQVLWQAKFLRRFHEAKDIETEKEEGFVEPWTTWILPASRSTTITRWSFPTTPRTGRHCRPGGRSSPATASVDRRSARSKSRRSCARPSRCNSPMRR